MERSGRCSRLDVAFGESDMSKSVWFRMFQICRTSIHADADSGGCSATHEHCTTVSAQTGTRSRQKNASGVRYDELQQELILLHSFVRRINRRHRPSICLGSHARWGHLGPEELPTTQNPSTTSRFRIDVTSIASRCPVHTHAVSAMTDERNGRLWTVRTTTVALCSVLLGAALLACSGLCNGASCWGSRWEVRLV